MTSLTPIPALRATLTNIKGLPEGNYYTKVGYSQTYAYKEVGRSPSGQTIYVKPIQVAADPDWTPRFLPGGYCAHCENQHAQTWLYEQVLEEMPVEAIRLGSKKARADWREGARHFYDYNF